MPRRGENIYKRKDGRWEGRYIVDRRPDGRAIYHSIYGPTYGEVRQKLKTQQEAHHKRLLRGCTMTVKELFTHWQEENGQIKPTTRERYRALIEKHIQPELGAYRVCDLTEELLKLFVEKKLKSGRLDGKGGLSPKTVNDICVLVKSALKLAKRKYHYRGDEEIRSPAVRQKQIDVLSEWESQRISAAVVQNPNLEKPFPHEEELRVKSARLAELNAELNIDERTPMEQLADDSAISAKAERPSVLAKLKAPLSQPRTEEKNKHKDKEER